MAYSCFYFKGAIYDKGSIVHIHEEHKRDFGFCSRLIFEEYDEETGVCRCRSMHSCWDRYEISVDESNLVTEDTDAAEAIKNWFSEVQEYQDAADNESVAGEQEEQTGE